jgi:hypothetical protein
LAAGNNEDNFWVQLLVVVMLAAGAGIYGLVKSRAKVARREASDEVIEALIEQPSVSQKKRELHRGMELLDRVFLVGVIEHTDSADQRDITMRRLCFTEIVRRGELVAVASDALRVYTVDAQGFYGKSIRCWAMNELAARTGPGTGVAVAGETTEEPGRRTGTSPTTERIVA